ncbi:MAG: fatty acid desaturase [Parasphingorhabdus sp.]|uniref:fatty acid desaturase family protein n=1 Tax=Parasphingorhabdus sp. TaxID=2709688 RepID=UPI00300154A8
MPSVKAARPSDVFTPDNWAQLTTISKCRGPWLIVHAWIIILAAIAFALWAAHPLIWIVAIILVGSRQLGLAILMHDGAHGLLHPNRKVNNFLGQWASGIFTGSDLQAYRAYHLMHHRYTQQPEDPDLRLSQPFPTSKASMVRKVLRDLTGLTFLKQRGGQILTMFSALRLIIASRGEVLASYDKKAGRPEVGLTGEAVDPQSQSDAQTLFIGKVTAQFLLVQIALLALSYLSGFGALPFLIWIVALATTFQLFLRIRNIAEHACTSTGSDDPFTHARTTYANWLERATVAPYWVNYHSEHHLFMGVPCYNLSEAHTLLMVKGLEDRMTIANGYWDVMKQVTRPATA